MSRRANRAGGHVYILHFDGPLATGRKASLHYVGWSPRWEYRIARHREGKGARIMLECLRRGIGFRVAVVLDHLDVRRKGGATETLTGTALERHIKHQHHHKRYCPVCGAAIRDYRDL